MHPEKGVLYVVLMEDVDIALLSAIVVDMYICSSLDYNFMC